MVSLNFLITRYLPIALLVGVVSCRAQIDVKTAKGPPAPVDKPEEPLPPEKIPDPPEKKGTTKPVREILPAATDNIWQTRSFIKIQLADDIASAPINSLVLINRTTGIELGNTELTVDACGAFKCVLIPASFIYEGSPFFAYSVNELELISQGTSEDLKMPHRLTVGDFRVFGSVNHVPSAVETGAGSILRPIGASLISVQPKSNSVIPKSYFIGHWHEQVERP